MAHVFTKGIHRQQWVQITPVPNAHAAGMGTACDMRNDLSRNPFVYHLISNSVLNRYNVITKASSLIANPGLGGTYGAGAGAVFAPSHALTGTISTGCTTSLITTSTIITPIASNMLANRGGSGDCGFKIRIIGKVSGKTEERWIIGNTGGTTPSFRLDSPLSFTPSSGDTYELLSGRVFCLGAGTLGATSFRSFEVGTNTLASKGYTNLPATISTEFSAVALDELYVPASNKPGEGLVKGTGTYDVGSLSCIIATASTSNTITGQATGGDAVIEANEYRNFQIRIVEDTTTPTAVGQRRIIASHTAGPSVVYTLGTAWTVTPSANAKIVIENPNQILLFSSGSTSTFTYNYSTQTINNGTNSIAADAWSTTYYAARGSAPGAGNTSFPSFGIDIDIDRNARHSFIHSFRGGNSVALDVFNIAGGTTGSWSNATVYDGGGPVFNTGSCGKYAPFDNEGRFGYINLYAASATNQIYRYDVKNRVLSPFTPTDVIQSGTAAAGDRIGVVAVFDNNDKYSNILLVNHLSTIAQELIVEL